MPPLPRVHAKQIIAALEKVGFVIIRKRGSHVMLRHNDGRRSVIPVHGKKDIPRGTLHSILKDCEIDREEFVNLLK